MESTSSPTVVLLTGASSGIGRALALEYGAVGCRVLLTGRSVERLQAVAEEVRRVGGLTDVLPASLEELAEVEKLAAWAQRRAGPVDILINNAGYGVRALMEDVPAEDLQGIFQVNVFAPVRLTQLVLPAMRERRRGQIINIGSVLGRRSVPTVGPYCMTKFSLEAFSEALRAEVARHGIHVLQVDPGQTRTEFLRRQQVRGEHAPYGHHRLAMTPESCARAIVRAARRRKDRVTLGGSARLLLLAERCSHVLVNRILARYVERNYPR